MARKKFNEIPADARSLGEAIRLLREKQGITLRALARTVGVSAPFLSDVEHDRRSPTMLDEIAAALNADPEELQKLSTRMPADVRAWIKDTPGVVQLLRQMRDSRKSPEELRRTLLKKR